GMTAAALLPTYAHGLYSKSPNAFAAKISMALGTVTYLVWALFMNVGTASFLPICKLLTGSAVLFPGSIVSGIDAVVIALPVSIIAMVIVLIAQRQIVRNEVSTI
ncbi:MAG TPA: hypothetical protein VJY42_03855, partial [Candidatus Methanomethylophilaceae archaeon]|nr:hypothetical protein [Candidatus Methanomethylophilaceae archaeon]